MFLRILDGLSRLQDRLVSALTAVAVAFLVPMMFLVAADVIGRYIFSRPLPGVVEVESYFLMVLVVFFPLAYVHRRGEHIFVTIFTERFSPRVKAALDILAIAVGILCFGLIGWYGLDVALVSTRVKDTIPGIVDIPIWISKWFVPIGAFVFCFELLADMARHCRLLVRGASRGEAS